MIISIANHKGGTGKTTTTINLACGLKQAGKSVLLVDLDPQGNLSYCCGVIDPFADTLDWLLGTRTAEETVREINGIRLFPASLAYYDKEAAFAKTAEEQQYSLLRHALEKIPGYDFILIDCPPSFSSLTESALTASDFVVIPTLFDVLSIQGIDQALRFISSVIENYNPALQVLGVLGVNVDERRQLTYEVLEYIRDHYNVNIFNNYIRANVKAAEAPSFAKSVIEYAPESNSAKDYLAFTRELLSICNSLRQEIKPPELIHTHS